MWTVLPAPEKFYELTLEFRTTIKLITTCNINTFCRYIERLCNYFFYKASTVGGQIRVCNTVE